MTVLVVAEHRHGELRDVTLEMLTAGRQLADVTDGNLHAAVVSGNVDTFADHLNREGVNAIHTVDYGEEYNHDVYVQVLEQLAEKVEPTYVLTPNSVNGLDFAPALAERLDMPLVTDAIAFDDDEDRLVVTRELYGGKVEGSIEVPDERAVITVRGGEWPASEGTGKATIQSFDATVDESAIRADVMGFQEVGAGDVDITDADVIVAVGRGIEEEDNLHIVEELADTLDATLAASRPIVDNGWLSSDRQVGQSGKVVSPDVYIAIGISGAVQHVAGMRGSDTIIAINDDPSAPIFDIADYGIVDDLFEVVPRLTEQFPG